MYFFKARNIDGEWSARPRLASKAMVKYRRDSSRKNNVLADFVVGADAA